MQEIDNFYLNKEENLRHCLLALRDIILNLDENITTSLKYGMPFFLYKGKMFCYLWVKKETNIPYLGIVEGKRIEHPDLVLEERARMKIMLFDTDKDLPIKKIKSILNLVLDLYRTGVIKVK